MTKEIEKLSAWYDGEISQDDFDEGLKSLENNSKHKKILHQYAILSELMQRKSEPQTSNLTSLINSLSQVFLSLPLLSIKIEDPIFITIFLDLLRYIFNQYFLL